MVWTDKFCCTWVKMIGLRHNERTWKTRESTPKKKKWNGFFYVFCIEGIIRVLELVFDITTWNLIFFCCAFFVHYGNIYGSCETNRLKSNLLSCTPTKPIPNSCFHYVVEVNMDWLVFFRQNSSLHMLNHVCGCMCVIIRKNNNKIRDTISINIHFDMQRSYKAMRYHK